MHNVKCVCVWAGTHVVYCGCAKRWNGEGNQPMDTALPTMGQPTTIEKRKKM